MSKRIWLAIPIGLTAVVACVSLYSQGPSGGRGIAMTAGASFRIQFGVGDEEETSWDGSVAVSPGTIQSIRGWRFTPEDSTDSTSTWKASSRRRPGSPQTPGPVLENGVVIVASGDDPKARFDVKTAQGSFSFRAGEIGWGDIRPFLAGRVRVDRVPVVTELTTSTDEQDFPAIAQTDDAVYLTYVEFAHADRQMEGNRALTEEPKSFDYLARPVGGDQVFLMRYSKADRTWGPPMPVSAPKQDVMRAAVAVDGRKRVWVFWSANHDGNFDIYAKSMAGGNWSPEVRISSDPGSDLNPAAAADASGRVWVTWQGYRKNNLEILVAVQNGDSFSPETVVSFSKASDWDPAIATAANGEVAVAWDTYDKGDYDVYFRHLRMDGGIKMDAPVPVAASTAFEARVSLAYDSQNRLWVAYEASVGDWGKDWGAYETTGIALYQDPTAKVKCFQGSQALAPAGDLAAALPGGAPAPPGQPKKQPTRDLTFPNPEIVRTRQPNQNPELPTLPKYSFPRIAADRSGTIYLTFRTRTEDRSPLGGIWRQNVAYLDGGQWKGPITIPSTDYWLDVRAAMAPIGSGELLLVAVSDHRQPVRQPVRQPGAGGSGDKKAAQTKQIAQQKQLAAAANLNAGLNADLYVAEFRNLGSKPAIVRPATAEIVAAAGPGVVPERQQIKTIRGYRVSLGSDRLQIMRGEFHRHTDISADGEDDGPLVDAYRYMIDTASMDWGGCCDHDNGAGREYPWWLIQKYTDAYHLPGTYTPMFSYERSVPYPEGHRNVVFPKRGIRPLSRLPLMPPDTEPTPAPDTQMLFRYLKHFGGIAASHTSGTNMGTDWRDNDPQLEPIVEIYQGARQNYEIPGGPRSNSAADSIGGWRPLGFVSLALMKGYRLGFQASSDHLSTHMSYCNLWVTAPTREGVMEALHKRRVYGATDNILADVRCQRHFMGEEFTTSEPPAISVKLWGTATFAEVHIIKDNQYVYAISPATKNVDFTWRDTAAMKGKTSYYYIRGEQSDGELVWVSPMWITYQ